MTRSERVEMYRGYLREEGYSPKLDKDGDVEFKYEGGTYVIVVEEKDADYFNMIRLFWPIEDAEERRRAHKAALEVTKNIKAAKVIPYNNDVMCVSIESFYSPVDTFKPVFKRLINALHGAMHEFKEKMNEE